MTIADDVRVTIADLENDVLMREIHDRMRTTLHPLATLTFDEDLPEHFTRGDSMAVRLPTLTQLAQSIQADTLNFPTTSTVNLAQPPFQDSYQRKAEKLEKWLSMWRARIDDGRVITQDTRGHLLLSSYSVMQLHCGDPGSDFPWSIEVPDPLSCYFPVSGAPFRPKLYGRKYQQAFKDLSNTYSNRRKYSEGKELVRTADGRLTWSKLGDDTSTYDATTGSGRMMKHEVWELHEGDDICVVAIGLDKKSTEVIWEGKSLTGGVNAVVTSAGGTALRDRTRLQPMLMPAYQYMIILNNLRAARASRSIGARPDVFFNPSPDQISAMAAVSGNAQAFQKLIEEFMSFQQSGPRFIVAPGEPIPWQLQQDPDLDKSIEDVAVNLSAWVAGFQQTANEKVIQEANTNVFLPYAEAIRNKQAPMLSQSDWAWRQMEQMALASIKEYDRSFPLFSTGSPMELHGNYQQLAAGTEIELSPADIDLDRFSITVTTNSVTEAEQRLRIQDFAYRESIGISSRRELIGSAGYADVDLQIRDLAKDKGVAMGVAWNDQVLAQYLQDYMRIFAGILIPTYGMAPQLPPQASTTAPQPYSPPAINGATGGSQ